MKSIATILFLFFSLTSLAVLAIDQSFENPYINDSLQKKEEVSPEKKAAIRKYNRLVKICNEEVKGFESEKELLRNIQDSINDIAIFFSEEKKGKWLTDIMLSRAYQLMAYEHLHKDSLVSPDSLDLLIVELYGKILDADSMNLNANYNLAVFYYNKGVNLFNKPFFEDSIIDVKVLTEEKMKAKSWFEKSEPFMSRALRISDKMEIRMAMSNLTEKDELTKMKGLGLWNRILFKSLKMEQELMENFEDSVKVSTLSVKKRQEHLIDFYFSRIAQVNKYIQSRSEPTKNLDSLNLFKELLYLRVLKIDSMDLEANYQLFVNHHLRLVKLIDQYYDSIMNKAEKLEIKESAKAEFNKFISFYSRYNNLLGNQSKFYLKEQEGYWGILNEEEQRELKILLRDKLIIQTLMD